MWRRGRKRKRVDDEGIVRRDFVRLPGSCKLYMLVMVGSMYRTTACM